MLKEHICYFGMKQMSGLFQNTVAHPVFFPHVNTEIFFNEKK